MCKYSNVNSKLLSVWYLYKGCKYATVVEFAEKNNLTVEKARKMIKDRKDKDGEMIRHQMIPVKM